MKCHYFKSDQCKSCDLLDNSYTDTLHFKENDLKQIFPHHLQLIRPTIGLVGDISESRNKAKFAAFNLNNQLTFGFYRSDGSCQELEKCPLHAEGMNALLPGIRDILNAYKIPAYDLKSKKGELKYLLMSKSGEGNTAEFLLRFVLRSKASLHSLTKAVTDLQALSPAISVISANIQPIHQAILEGEEEIVLSSNTFITHHFDEFELTLGTRSFFQVTSQIAKALYNAVSDAIQHDAPSSLIDLYCGVGAFSFYASRHCTDVTGVEISKEAIHCAKHSAQLNHKEIQFEANDVEAYLREQHKQFDAVIVNPPRRGLGSSIVNMIKDVSPRCIYYSSCNAKSLAKDFQELEASYDIKSLQIFDMFPYTKHYETLMCLQKKIL